MEKKLFDFNAHYAIIQEWWKLHNSFAPKKEHLSQTGIIIYNDNIPICAGFLYKTDSSICVFEFVISNPTIDKEIRDSGISRLIQEVNLWAADNKYSLIYTSVKSQKYIKRLLKNGYLLVDEGQSHLFKEVI